MAGRAPGRRRAPGHGRPAGRPSLLMLDYLETGLFRGRPDAAPSPRRRSRPAGSPASGVRRVLADGRVLAVAAIVAVALAILAGTSEPLPSAKAGPGRPSVTPRRAPPSP